MGKESNNINPYLASQMREMRLKRKMTMEEVSTLAFQNPKLRSAISDLENERKGATISTMYKIFDAMNCSLVIVPNEYLEDVEQIIKR